MTNWGHVLWAAMAAARSGAPDRGPAAGAGALPLLGAIGPRSHCPLVEGLACSWAGAAVLLAPADVPAWPIRCTRLRACRCCL